MSAKFLYTKPVVAVFICYFQPLFPFYYLPFQICAFCNFAILFALNQLQELLQNFLPFLPVFLETSLCSEFGYVRGIPDILPTVLRKLGILRLSMEICVK